MVQAILLACLSFAAPADTARVIIVATTDVHGNATAWDYALERPFQGGLTRAATIIDSLRRQYPEQVVVVDAGDLLQGSPFAAFLAHEPRSPHPIISAMNAMGYDAATPGNHDFDFGVPFLRGAVAAAKFKYVSGNVYTVPADTLLFPSHAVIRRGQIRVAVGGFTTTGVMLWDRQQLAGKIRVAGIGQSAPAVARSMRLDADLSVMLVHSGLATPSSYDTTGIGPENDAASLARGPDAPDLVVFGHTHRELRDTVIGRTHFTQPDFWARSVSVTHVLLERVGNGRWKVVSVTPALIPLADVAANQRIQGILAGPGEDARRWLGTPIGRATAPMIARFGRTGPTPLVNWIQSVQRQKTGAQLSAASVFRLEGGLGEGEISRGEIAGIYPYENTLKAIRITGAQLRAYLEQSARYYTLRDGKIGISSAIPGYNFDIVSGVAYDIDLSQPVGSRIRNLRYQGADVAPADSFTMALNSYRATGAGGYEVIAGAPVTYDKGESVRDLLIAAVEQQKVIDPASYAEKDWRITPPAADQQVKLLFGAAAAAKPRAARMRDSVLLRVLSMNDLHGALTPRVTSWSKGRTVGGVATLDAMMDSATAECRCPTIRLDAGDELQGTLESSLLYGRSTIQAMNRMKIAAAAIGNHELDWGVDTLRARMAEAKYPFLAANLVDSATGKRPDWVKPWAMIQVDSLRVAVIGYMAGGTKGMVRRENTAGLRWRSGFPAIADIVDEVKAKRPSVIILLAHEGGFCEQNGCNGEIFDLAKELPAGSIDLIVAGHTHVKLATEANGIPIVEAQSSGTAIGVTDLVRRADGGVRGYVDVRTSWNDQVTPDSALGELTYQMKKQVGPLASRQIAVLAQPLDKEHEDGEYPLGDFIADAQRNLLRADVSLMNNGGIRASLASGAVTYENLFTLQPFGNRIVVLLLSGQEIRAALEHALETGVPTAHVSGITVYWDSTRAPGQRITEVTLPNRKKLQDNGTYRVAVNDFLATGGSGYTMLVGKPQENTSMGDIEVLELYLKRLAQPVKAPTTTRFSQKKK
jgi:2',3'-cyclic-nucleotide 2'-phosphodiesterase (5'-nucleotidase family)